MEWIKTRDRLPTENGRYLVLVGGGYDIRSFKDGRFYGGNEKVDLWQPLPERPKGYLEYCLSKIKKGV